MPPKSKAKSVSAECDLCCQQFQKDNERLKCEGACGAVVHRYCAGVTRAHFDKIHKGQATFVCQYCELSLSKAVHQQLQSELQALKEQLTEVKRVLQTDTAADRITGIQDIAPPAATAPLANRCDNSETPALATEFQALRKEFDALRAVIDGNYNPRSYAQVTAGLHSQRGKRNRKKAQVEDKQGVTFASTSSTSTTTSSANPDPQVNRAKERVIGSRKIWGTLKSTTTAAVSSTLAKLTSVQPETQVQVKRKYKLSDKKTVRWWFVVRGTEEVLTKIENEWERVSLQTNWKMEPVLRFQSAVDSAESQSAADSAESQSATVSAESQSATVSAESPSETTSQPFLGEV